MKLAIVSRNTIVEIGLAISDSYTDPCEGDTVSVSDSVLLEELRRHSQSRGRLNRI